MLSVKGCAYIDQYKVVNANKAIANLRYLQAIE